MYDERLTERHDTALYALRMRGHGVILHGGAAFPVHRGAVALTHGDDATHSERDDVARNTKRTPRAALLAKTKRGDRVRTARRGAKQTCEMMTNSPSSQSSRHSSLPND